MAIHAAKPARSARLRRVLAALRGGAEISSLALAMAARTVAPGTCVSELRANGYAIACRQEATPAGRVWLYRLVSGPESAAQEAKDSAATGV